MSNFFVDTSALGKRYITEVGSAWVRSWIHPRYNNVVIISDLTPVETASIFARLRREGRISLVQQTRLQNIFMLHVEREYLVIPVDGLILAQAQLLVNRYPLRTLDAIQLATAMRAEEIIGEQLTVVSGDTRLFSAADSEGFAVENPTEHP